MSTNRNSMTKDEAILRSLLEHCTYEHPHLGSMLSKLLPNGEASAIQLLRKARFVEAILSSNEPGVQFIRTPERYVDYKITPLGRRWYDIACDHNTFAGSAGVEVGASIALFDAIAKELALPSNLFTGSPLKRHGDSAPNEGEYLNGFIDMLRHCAGHKRFVTNREREAKAIKDQLRPAKGVIKRIPREFNTVIGRWCNLTYCSDGHQPTPVSQREAFAFLTRFQTLLDQHIADIPSIGHTWFPQYLPEIGFTFRVLMTFVTSPVYETDAWATLFHACWHEATDAKGHFVIGREVEGQAAIRDELIYMGEVAKLLHLKFNKTYPLCGVVDAQVKAEAEAGIELRKLNMDRLIALTTPLLPFKFRSPAPEPTTPTEATAPTESNSPMEGTTPTEATTQPELAA